MTTQNLTDARLVTTYVCEDVDTHTASEMNVAIRKTTRLVSFNEEGYTEVDRVIDESCRMHNFAIRKDGVHKLFVSYGNIHKKMRLDHLYAHNSLIEMLNAINDVKPLKGKFADMLKECK